MYEEFVVPKAGVLVDRWSGARLLKDAGELRTVLQAAPRVWLITDGFRLATRYDADFLRTVIENFDSVYEERGVLALLATGLRPQPNYTVDVDARPACPFWAPGLDALAAHAGCAGPGAGREPGLAGRRAHRPPAQHLAAGRCGGREPSCPGRWPPGAAAFCRPISSLPRRCPIPRVLSLPADLASGRYRLELVVYDVETSQPVGEPLALDWFTIGEPPAAPAVPVDAAWQDGLALVGHDALPATLTPGAPLNLRLVWQAADAGRARITRFSYISWDLTARWSPKVTAPWAASSIRLQLGRLGNGLRRSYTLVLPATVGARRLYPPRRAVPTSTGERLAQQTMPIGSRLDTSGFTQP